MKTSVNSFENVSGGAYTYVQPFTIINNFHNLISNII